MKNINYTFVCIGTDKIIEDSFGPRVGNKLNKIFYSNPEIIVYGTMKNPIHLKNATHILQNIKKTGQLILIDSAIGKKEQIGSSYLNKGGVEIGKAFNQSIYFPADFNIKTVIGSKEYIPNYSVNEIENLAEDVSKKITNIVLELLV